jgi:peptide/nickel transport system substrate-binding protein
MMAVMLMVVLSLLAACGGSPTPPPSKPATPPAPPAKAAGGTLRFGSEGDVNYMNPAVEISTLDAVVNAWLFDQLMIIGKDGRPEPRLAKRWEVSPDGKTVTFYLRDDVKWHDGQPFTAEDVEFTIYAILTPTVTSRRTGQFTALVGYADLTNRGKPVNPKDLPKKPVEVLDKYTIRFNLSRPDPTFIPIALDVGILPKHILKAEVDAGVDLLKSTFNQKPVGCGPFKFVEWRRDERIVFEAFPGYYGGKPFLDRIIYQVVPDAVVLDTMLESGDVDFVRRLREADLERIKAKPNLTVISRDTIGYAGVVFNNERPRFSDKRVRQAICYAIDVKRMTEEFVSKAATISASPFSPALGWAYNPNLKPYPYDKNKALALLKEAGWTQDSKGVLRDKAGQEFRFTLDTFDFAEERKQCCIYIQQELSKIGMQVDMSLLATPVLLSNTEKGQYDAAFVAYGGKADPDYNAVSFESQNIGKGNIPRYKNPEFDKVAAQARQQLDPEKRKVLYWQAAQILHDDAPVLWSYHTPQHHGINKKFTGWVITPDVVGPFRYMHLVKMAQ